jgi:CRISPR-associated protein Csh1
MINAMRTLALDYLFDKLGDKNNPPQNLEKWYHELRPSHPENLSPFLVEDVSNIMKVYILYTDKTDSNLVNMDVEDMTEQKARKLPFKQYRARAIGPVIKRSKAKSGISPNTTTQRATLKYFKKVGQSSVPWALYFKEISEILDRPNIKALYGNVIETGEDKKWPNIYSAALDLIPSEKGTVMVTVADKENRWPGERFEYLNYLANELSTIKYCTGDAPAQNNQTCPLCGASGVTVFPNALKGAGINLSNVDREGAFPGIDITQAWKRYPLCGACADLLYIYKFHVLRKDSKNRNPFITSIAGDGALVIPFTTVDYHVRLSIWKKVEDFVKSSSSDVEEDEAGLLDILKEEKGILNLTFLWAAVGQNIEKVSGMITDVPPTRLVYLSKISDESRDWKHPLFPEIRYFPDKRINFQPDLSLRALKSLFYRPGGKKAKDANASMKLQQLRKSIAACVYHKEKLPVARFWEEIMVTARWYWLDAIENGSAYGLLNEGRTKKGEPYLTAAGWIRHLCWWIYYFKKLEVMNMEDNFYEPNMENLKPYFGPEGGINSPQKAFTFLLGVLYGKVLQVQGARGVNVGANALTWLKRLTLKGRDLPELYIKIREKLLAYETEKSSDVRELISEIGLLGIQLGDNIDLEEISTNYYLLLGQSMTTTILPKKEEKENG